MEGGSRIVAARQKALSTAELRALANLDEYERTRLSYIYNGVELGTIRPTAATEGRLKPDPLTRLLNNDTITKDQHRSALEIAEIYGCLTSSMLARAGNAERVARGVGGVSERLASLHADYYLPWAYYLGGRPVSATPKVKDHYAKVAKDGRCRPALEIAIDVAADGLSLSEVDARRHWRHGTAKEFARYAFALYSDLRGWEQNRELIASFEATWKAKAVA